MASTSTRGGWRDGHRTATRGSTRIAGCDQNWSMVVVPPIDHDCVLKELVEQLANRLEKLEGANTKLKKGVPGSAEGEVEDAAHQDGRAVDARRAAQDAAGAPGGQGSDSNCEGGAQSARRRASLHRVRQRQARAARRRQEDDRMGIRAGAL